MIKKDLFDLNSLKDTDLYSLSLFILFKLSLVKQPAVKKRFTAISELPYLLDKDSMLRMCKYLGGQTITIPTVEEFYEMLKVLLLYQYHIIEGNSWERSLDLVGYAKKEHRSAKKCFAELLKVLETYNVNPRDMYE